METDVSVLGCSTEGRVEEIRDKKYSYRWDAADEGKKVGIRHSSKFSSLKI